LRKQVVILGFVCLVLFLIAVNLGVGNGGGSDRPAWAERLGNILHSSPRALTTSDLAGDCIQGYGLFVTNPCHLTADRSSRSREADLVLTAGLSAKVTVTQPDAFEIDVDLKPGKKARISVLRKGAAVRIVCGSEPAPCAIDLLAPKG
jgi:hypothetical protein